MRSGLCWAVVIALTIEFFGPACPAGQGQDIAAAPSSAAPAKAGPAKVSDFTSPDFCAAIALRPSRMMKSSLLKSMPSASDIPPVPPVVPGVDFGGLAKALDLTKIRLLVLFADVFADGNTVFPALVIQFEEDVQGRELLDQVFKDLKPETFAGQEYFKSEGAKMNTAPIATCVPDSRTILVAPEPTLKKMLGAKGTRGPLLAEVRRHGVDNDAIAMLVTGPIVSGLTKFTGKPLDAALKEDKNTPPWAKTALKDVKAASLALNLSGDTLARAEITAANEAAGQRMLTMLKGLHELGKQAYEAAKQKPPADLPPDIAQTVMDLGDQVLSGMEIAGKDDQVTVTVKMPPALAELARKAGAMLKPGAKQ